MGDSRPLPTGRERASARTLAAVAAGLLALLALVALASRAHRPLGGERTAREPSTVFWDYLFSVSLAVYLVGALLVLCLFAVKRRQRRTEAPRRTVWHVVFLIGLLVLGLTFADRLAELRGDEQAVTATVGETATVASTAPSDAEPYEPEFRWLPVLVLGGAGALTAVLLAARRRARRRPPPALADQDLADELAALLDDALDDLRAEPDPRRAVIAAYARMERALAAYGLPRRPFEAPLEYLERVAPDLLADRPAPRRLVFELTHLFERAKFSAHAIDREMKDDAIATLSALRDELRGGAARTSAWMDERRRRTLDAGPGEAS